jgi:hypothetical protein
LCQQFRAIVELTFRGMLSDSERSRIGELFPATINAGEPNCPELAQ